MVRARRGLGSRYHWLAKPVMALDGEMLTFPTSRARLRVRWGHGGLGQGNRYTSELARSVRPRVGSRDGGVRYTERESEIGAVEGGVVSARARLRALVAQGGSAAGHEIHP